MHAQVCSVICLCKQQAAEKAVAQSNREISGYQVASISMTADRVAHYQQVTGGPRDQPMVDDTDQPGHALSLQSLLPHLTTSLPLPGRMHGHEQVSFCWLLGHPGATSVLCMLDDRHMWCAHFQHCRLYLIFLSWYQCLCCVVSAIHICFRHVASC